MQHLPSKNKASKPEELPRDPSYNHEIEIDGIGNALQFSP
jgi:hypothetical protein